MELRAVIEAIRSVDPQKSIIIRTDSQYVSNAVNKNAVVKTNTALWSEFQELSKARRIRVVWIKGHAGDIHNERADRLASEQAEQAKNDAKISRAGFT
jgi:ribonuclease HI